MKWLICDLNVYENGHHLAFIKSIVAGTMGLDHICFLLNGHASRIHPSLKTDKRVHFLEEENLQRLKSRVLLRTRFREYQYIKDFALKNQVEELFFMDIDQYQVPIGLCKVPFRVGGIYFRSFHRIHPMQGPLGEIVPTLIYKFKKRFLFAIFRLNKKVTPVFLLNDLDAARKFPRFFNYLPDPVFPYPLPSKGLPIREEYGIGPTAHVFLIFGAISKRKNVENIIRAFAHAEIPVESVLLIIGRVRPDYQKPLNNLLGNFKKINKSPLKRVLSRDEFVTEDKMEALFKEANTIVLCYQKFYGSSGLLGQAALAGKASLVSDKGLLAETCRQYRLGVCCHPGNVQSIAEAMEKMVKNIHIHHEDAASYLHTHTETQFIHYLTASQSEQT